MSGNTWIERLRAEYEASGSVYAPTVLENLEVGQILSSPVGMWHKAASHTLQYAKPAEPSTWWQFT